MSALALVTLAAGTAPKHPVSGDMLSTVGCVTFFITWIICTLIFKKMGVEEPGKNGAGAGCAVAFLAIVVVIMVIAAHRM